MKKSILSAAVVAALPFYALGESQPIDLGSIEVVDTAQKTESKVGQKGAAAPIQSYDPIDTGTTVISQDAIKQSTMTGLDTTEVIESLPGVQLDVNNDQVNEENIQSLRPADFAINGSNYYENNIMIDGIGVNSVLDVSNNSYGSIEDVAGITAQSMYVDSSLLERADVMTSNVSAEYGSFLGGAVNYEIRDPKKEFHMSMSGKYQNDSFVDYIYNKSDLAEDETITDPPEYSKYKGTVSFDLPVTDKLSLLASYSRGESSVKYTKDESYGGSSYHNGDTSEIYLLKGLYEYRDDLTFRGQIIYSPYRSDYANANRINSDATHKTDGLQGYIKANGYVGLTTWESKFAATDSELGKRSENYQATYKGTSVDWCTSTTCKSGGYGDLDISQKDYEWTFKIDTPVLGGNLAAGSELKYTKVQRNRLSDFYSYYSPLAGDWDCDDGDVSCNSGSVDRYAILYPENYTSVGYATQALWSEYTRGIGPVEVRLGLRLDHDNYLDNYNLSPRSSISWEFMPDTYFNVGLNRYYSNNQLTYALRDKIAATTRYKRTVNSSTGEIGEWEEVTTNSTTNYNVSDLKTPHTDELSLKFIVPTFLEGKVALEANFRHYRDRFSRSDKITDDDGSYYNMTNDGKGDYQGYTIKWNGGFEHHKFGAQVTWSKTKSYGQEDYDSNVEYSDTVYYHGDLMTESELYSSAEATNFAAPMTATISWTADWFNERLITNTAVKYRGKYNALEDTNDVIEVDGDYYNVYDEVERDAFTSVDMKAMYKLIDTDTQQLNIEAEVTNLFNKLPDTDTASGARYQQGRAIWLGFSYYM